MYRMAVLDMYGDNRRWPTTFSVEHRGTGREQTLLRGDSARKLYPEACPSVKQKYHLFRIARIRRLGTRAGNLQKEINRWVQLY